MRVGFLGIQCDTANMGLAALAYAAVNLLHTAVPLDADFVLFSVNSGTEIRRMQETLGLGERRVLALPFRHRNPLRMVRSWRDLAACDVVIDFTGGDSFSDIYGVRRLAKKLLHKEMVIRGRTPLVLAPQTYGPFRSRMCLPWVRHVIDHAAMVCTRDQLSADCLARLTDREVLVSTDVAVTLPFDSQAASLSPTSQARVGVNVSGLLWNGGYTEDNQFNLRTDYRAYCDGVIDRLLAAGHEVHLIPHVLSRGNAEDEDDIAACRAMQIRHPACVLSPIFASPVEAKSYISGMDALIGSRMHATIASFTTGVPTVPVAYSRKFVGFFANLGYSPLVDLTVLDTETAVARTLAYVAERRDLVGVMAAANVRAQTTIRVFMDSLVELLDSLPQR